MATLQQHIANYKKPTPDKWRMIGDYILVVTVFIDGSLPAWPIPDNVKIYVGAVANFIGISLKFWTNTKKDTPVGTDAETTNGSEKA